MAQLAHRKLAPETGSEPGRRDERNLAQTPSRKRHLLANKWANVAVFGTPRLSNDDKLIVSLRYYAPGGVTTH